MTLRILTSVDCDGCDRSKTTSWSISGRKGGRWSTRKQFGWKTFDASSRAKRRDYCPDCVATGKAKR